jgi:hypothetical protein
MGKIQFRLIKPIFELPQLREVNSASDSNESKMKINLLKKDLFFG